MTSNAVLLIEDNPADIRFIQELIRELPIGRYRLTTALTLKEGRELISDNRFDVILLDLNLPDCTGKATFHQVITIAGNVPVILVSGLEDEELHISLIKEGAQDYLIKSNMNSMILDKSVRYAVERKRIFELLLMSETNLRAIFENTVAGYILLDGNFNIVTFNPRAAELSEWILKKTLCNNVSFISLLPHERQNRVAEYLTKSLTGVHIHEEVTYWIDDGKSVYLEINCRPITGDDGKVVRLSYSIKDITAFKIQERKLLMMNKKLVEIAFMQAHQVRSPVANILGLFQLFRFDVPADPINGEILWRLKSALESFDAIIREVVMKTYDVSGSDAETL